MFKDTLEGAKKNFGFGCMRLNLLENSEVDLDNFKAMVDCFMENGFNYFDTAHGYINYKSEPAIKEALVKRYPRDSYILTNKLSEGFFKTEEELLPLFELQLDACGVDYFDYYLMHAQNAEYFEKYQKLHVYEFVNDLIKQGRVKHLGISFHDKADVLDHILTERPEIEVVQLQFNYLDYESDNVESRKCYEVCQKHNKPVIVMEPVRGGSLVRLPKVAQDVLDSLGGAGSNASYAIRFAASFENVKMVLSGMNDVPQMLDNISYMKEFEPLNKDEMDAVFKVADILKNQNVIPCTACEYCVNECPMEIPIPNVFANVNKHNLYDETINEEYISKAKQCIKCGKCEHICPQKIEIRKLLENVGGEE